MVRLLLCFLIFNFSLGAFAQQDDPRILFSEALALHLPKYEKQAKNAYRLRNYEKAHTLFDTLVQEDLNGSYMDNFELNDLKGKKIYLYNIKKPVYLITYASWCIATEGEIPAINALASKYQDQVEFVILFWDTKKVAKKMSKDYSNNITVLYVDEQKNNDSFVISQLKHSLGLPTTFLLDGTKKILDIRRGITHPLSKTFDESYKMNYNSIHDGIANHLLFESKKFTLSKETVAINNN
ncbi:Thiol-disulfide isomerase or thioredoxin [Gillisia sp. Hel1_33_143]|uniref:TlpA family protein disulfide reductase n=1 Tax=Gillisia sp. Hel1_33_143 TaxID=1336796 RepID=UPI0008797FAB|nr:TlpA disulfide reductase family protein [Gillisia sp. Hel1_33_143]SDS48735.1 Thiol-disulfide isomerase or thioredoxin [Gillisia sp. Hel1_33_143]